MIKLGTYRKTIVAVIGAGVAIATSHFGAGGYVADAVLVLTALGVYGVSNESV